MPSLREPDPTMHAATIPEPGIWRRAATERMLMRFIIAKAQKKKWGLLLSVARHIHRKDERGVHFP